MLSSTGSSEVWLHLPETKTTRRVGATGAEFVQVECPLCCFLLQHFAPGPRQSRAARITRLEPWAFRELWKASLERLGLAHRPGFQLYSLRRGGATADWQRFRNMDRTLARGRWNHARTARLYVREGERALADWEARAAAAAGPTDLVAH